MTSVSYPVSVSTSSSSSVVTQERVSTPTSPYTPPLAEPIEHQPPSIVASIQSNSEINRMTIPTTIDFGAMRTNTLILPTTCGEAKPNCVTPVGSVDAVIQPTRKNSNSSGNPPPRLNKFVRRLHDMLQSERQSGIVEWRKGLLVLHSTDAFAKTILPRYFNTKNFKTFRRQLNYYGFVHVRSFSATGSSTTALWVNRDLATRGTGSISSVLMLKRIEPCDSAKTAEGRRVRKEEAVSTVEDDMGINANSLQLDQFRSNALRREGHLGSEEIHSYIMPSSSLLSGPPIPMVVHCHQPISSSTCLPPTSLLRAPPLWSYNMTPDRISVKKTVPEEREGENTNDAATLLLMLSKSIVS
eukprot:CAMPEP_0198291574 /NCGR_PEP_ID=MMETSP1449-20131203/9052_1 /TAXON_ID=420275 /ORGANISM="Attheya septentrionalis, Strain CCMP2084" /LENGTH=355 /DNA_ID=CAMNT_0043990233 /DNA_START=331 /DNA_END=1398 /DNA_ORIENTATION=+